MNFKDFRKHLLIKSRTPYILVLRNRETWEDKFSVILTPLNLLLIFSGTIVLFSLIILLLLTRTPLKEYVYGGGSGETYKMEYLKLSYLMDSLEKKVETIDLERNNLLNILMGRDSVYKNAPKSDTTKDVSGTLDLENLSPEEQALRQQLENGDIHQMDIVAYTGNTMYTPVQGFVTDTFNIQKNHYALDISAPKNSAVKSVLNGTVILSTWTPDNGNIIIIQHPNDFISVYKHNSALLKKDGNYVSAGEPVALVGNTGEFSSGYHLHFELWQNGLPVNPKDFILF
jgi:murein DD-endopeptidase MepM/ murein hydrolase activator NlpD